LDQIYTGFRCKVSTWNTKKKRELKTALGLDVSGLESCPVIGFGGVRIKPSGSVTDLHFIGFGIILRHLLDT